MSGRACKQTATAIYGGLPLAATARAKRSSSRGVGADDGRPEAADAGYLAMRPARDGEDAASDQATGRRLCTGSSRPVTWALHPLVAWG